MIGPKLPANTLLHLEKYFEQWLRGLGRVSEEVKGDMYSCDQFGDY
jgi:hypothetical protein